VSQYVALLKAVESGNPQAILASAIDFGLLDVRESKESQELFVQMMNLAIEPFSFQKSAIQKKNSFFDFGNADYSERSQSTIRAFVKSLKYSAPPHRIIFLHRKLGGIFALLKRLSIRMDISPYWDLMVENKRQS
jgi:aarF domain-containing kinase